MDLGVIPQIWKTSSIIPVPKGNRKGSSTDLNAFRPVALTFNVMKCLERLILKHLLSQAGSFIDPFQFAYRQNRGVEDAVLVLHGLYSHLDIPKSYVRCAFIDFSSAFNTITPHLLINKLIEMEVDVKIVLWVHNFLTNRQQSVRLENIKSPTLVTNTGAPQGCVLSPLLFSLYTSDCTSTSQCCSFIKYADDTAITGFIKEEIVRMSIFIKLISLLNGAINTTYI